MAAAVEQRRGAKSPDAFRTISEVAAEVDVPQHVLRFWESRFTQVRPLKRGGGRRYYRPEDVELLRRIRALLYAEGYTIKGVQKVLRENSRKSVIEAEHPSPPSGLAGEDESPGLSKEQRERIRSVMAELVRLKRLLKARAR